MHWSALLSLTLLCAALPPVALAAEGDLLTTKVSRLPALTDPMSDPILKQLFEDTRARGGQILNLHLTYAHAPKVGRASRTMAYTLRFDAEVPRMLRELAIIRTAQLLDAQYELNQHYPLGLACGLSKAQIDAMPSWKTSDLFDEKQRALLAYTEAVVTNRGEVDDATYGAFAKFFSPREIVELTMTIGSYTSTALFTKALKIQIETDGRGAAPGKC
jgi:alkylhydroperoxidase family enzyme